MAEEEGSARVGCGVEVVGFGDSSWRSERGSRGPNPIPSPSHHLSPPVAGKE